MLRIVSATRRPVVIVGGGLAGGLAALALAERRADVPVLLIEQGETFGGNHTWSFFDTDVAPENLDLIRPMVAQRWADHEVRFPRRKRVLDIGYNSIRSVDFDGLLRRRLRADRYRLGRRIASIAPGHVILEGGERIEAEAVVDARGFRPAAGLDLAWQKFIGRTYQFIRPHGVDRPIIMDALVEQLDGYRFLYSLPFGATEMLLEDTYYSTSPDLDSHSLGQGLDRRAGEAGVTGEERGVLPVVLGGTIEALWPNSEPVARIGGGGGFFHPTTSYSLPDAVRNAALLARQRDFSAAALYALFRQRAAAQWNERRFFRLLNRMLFRAAEPEQRYRVLEHFYRLPDPLIGRFYASNLGTVDKLRILSGRPPVPIGRALSAMREVTA